MSKEALFICGILIITIPTIEFGGTFLLRLASGWKGIPFTGLQKSFFRAGHAHAGVLVILALLVQFLVDAAGMDASTGWLVRNGTAAAPILISAGFFFAPLGGNGTKLNRLVWLIYAGAASLAASMVVLGLALISAGRG